MGSCSTKHYADFATRCAHACDAWHLAADGLPRIDTGMPREKKPSTMLTASSLSINSQTPSDAMSRNWSPGLTVCL